MNPKQCANAHCFAHDGEGCANGEAKITNCPQWQKTASGGNQTPVMTTQADVRVPWSGCALGLADLLPLLPRARHMLIGVLGAHDAGKTTLLIANYLQLLRGKHLGTMQFAGSRTLGAWEALAAWMRFHDAAASPNFPPHTPRGTGRVPGLLHLALRNELDEFRDVLLTDAPGEWFAEWAINETAAAAEGGQWIADNADAFLLIADCAQLSGENRGPARNALRTLIERLGNHVNKRPLILVWTKSEAQYCVPDGIRNAIQKALKDNIPDAHEMAVTISQPETLLAVLQTSITQCWNADAASPLPAPPPPIADFEPFYAFRGQYAAA